MIGMNGDEQERRKIHDIFLDLKNQRFQIGSVKFVNADTGEMDVYITSKKDYKGVKVNFGVSGLYHGIRCMPMKGDQVLLAYESEYSVYHVATIPLKYRQLIYTVGKDDSNSFDMRKLNAGESEICSCTVEGLPSASVTLLNSGRLELNAQGTMLYLDPQEGINFETPYFSFKGDTTRVSCGQVRRINKVTDEWEVKGVGGIPWTGIGDPLQEVYIAIGQNVDTSDRDKVGDANITIHVSDSIIDENGLIVLDQTGKKLQANIQFKSGAKIQINEDGVINVWEADLLSKPLKKVARNGDLVTTPLSVPTSSVENPGLTQKSIDNLLELQKLATMFVSPSGPCTLIPNGQSVNLKSEITDGSAKMVIGD